MRRENIDLSYKDRTSDIIKTSYSTWQLAYKNSNELAHILTNRLVSISQDLGTEIQYVEDMFFPDAMDINEEWLVYEVYGTVTKSDVLLSGSPIENLLTEATSMDEFIAGPYDHFDIISSGDMGFAISNACATNSGLAFISDNYIKTYNPDTLEMTDTSAYVITSGETTLYVSKGDIDFGFQTELENIVVYNPDGNPVGFSYIDKDSCNGEYLEKYDTDKNGVINKRELEYLKKYKGKTTSDYEPEEWEELKWMDVDADGKIGSNDYTYLTSIIPAMRGDIKSAVSLPTNSVGPYTMYYEVKVPRSTILLSDNGTYRIIYSDNPIAETYSKAVYDPETGILYGISSDDGMLYAAKLDDNFNITATSRIFVNTSLQKHTFIDLGMHNGYLFVLTSWNNGYYIFYEDTRKEFLEYIDRKAYIDMPAGITITGLVVDRTGYFFLHDSRQLFRVKAHRNKFISLNDTVYMNIDHEVTDLSGNPYTILPWNIFNSFDSFAYSFGIERPAGCDNIRMKELIYDFWKYRQDNSPIGINYGMKRELGIPNTPNSYTDIKYILPAQIILTGDISVNDIVMSKVTSGDITILSGTPGVIRISGDTTVIPDQSYYDYHTSVNLAANFLDGNMTAQWLSYNIVLTDKYTMPDIEVYSLGDSVYVNSERCMYTSGELVDRITELEASDPFIYKNMLTDIYPLNAARIAMIPMLSTKFGPVIDPDSEVTIEI